MLFAVALSGYVTDFDNNLIEYELEDVQPMQVSLTRFHTLLHVQIQAVAVVSWTRERVK